MIRIQLLGFDKGLKLLSGMPSRLREAQRKAVMMEGDYLAQKMRDGLDSQAPGGYPFAPHSPLYALMRQSGGSKILIASGRLKASIVVIPMGQGCFVGISSSNGDRARIAQIHEYGREWDQVLSDRARGFLFARMKELGIQSKPRIGNPPAKATIHIRIPARPFINPVLDQETHPQAVLTRYTRNLAALMKGDIGKP